MDIESLKRLLPLAKHLLITVGIGILLVVIFFYWYLPHTTNHGETITVPDIRNQHIDELEDILLTRNLRYEVNADSSFSPNQEPLTVIDQFPQPNSKVKENRKIYVTLNAQNPPLVKMPQLIDKSLKIAEITLQSYGLKSGKVEYKPDLGLNVVLEQWYDGREVLEGEMIPKGSSIDLFIGDGHGNRFFEMGDYVNRSFSDTRVALAGQGLKIGNITYVDDPVIEINQGDTAMVEVIVSAGYVTGQRPAQGKIVRLQDLVDLWVYQPDSIVNESSILDEN